MSAKIFHCGIIGTLVLLSMVCAGAETRSVSAPETFSDCSECPTLVKVPDGDFVMGSEKLLYVTPGRPPRRALPVRHVSVGSFALGMTEVTLAQFQAFLRETGYQPPTGPCQVYEQAVSEWTYSNIPDTVKPLPSHPVRCISWVDASAYVAWLAKKTGKGYRLPTEAEWEYASRGGVATDYVWGDLMDGCKYVNGEDQSAFEAGTEHFDEGAFFYECSDGFVNLAPVASLLPNRFGLYDMFGNVWEWVEDCQPGAAVPAGGNPADNYRAVGNVAGCERRGVRGGSWRSPIVQFQPFSRGSDSESWRSHTFGFRVARDL
ncbi:MAG: SUMF1/EgtB/PvdO family nonheme iron enzyme [Steroidobacteraceae bacterium]